MSCQLSRVVLLTAWQQLFTSSSTTAGSMLQRIWIQKHCTMQIIKKDSKQPKENQRCDRKGCGGAAADWHDHLPWVMLGIRASFREDSEFSPAEAVFGSQLILPGQFTLPSRRRRPFSTTYNSLWPAPRHRRRGTTQRQPHQHYRRSCSRFVLVRRDGGQPPLSPIYEVPYPNAGAVNTFLSPEMGERTNKVSTLRIKAARTPADTEPAKPPHRGRPVAQAPPVRTPPPTQRGRQDRWPSTFHQQHHQHQHPAARFATPGRQTDSTSEPAAAEFGGDLWWRTVCSYYISRLDRHVTYYTSHMLYINVHTRPSLP